MRDRANRKIIQALVDASDSSKQRIVSHFISIHHSTLRCYI